MRCFQKPLTEEGFETVTRSVTDIVRDPEWIQLEPLPVNQADETDVLNQVLVSQNSCNPPGLTPLDVHTDGSHPPGTTDMGFGAVWIDPVNWGQERILRGKDARC